MELFIRARPKEYRKVVYRDLSPEKVEELRKMLDAQAKIKSRGRKPKYDFLYVWFFGVENSEASNIILYLVEKFGEVFHYRKEVKGGVGHVAIIPWRNSQTGKSIPNKIGFFKDLRHDILEMGKGNSQYIGEKENTPTEAVEHAETDNNINELVDVAQIQKKDRNEGIMKIKELSRKVWYESKYQYEAEEKIKRYTKTLKSPFALKSDKQKAKKYLLQEKASRDRHERKFKELVGEIVTVAREYGIPTSEVEKIEEDMSAYLRRKEKEELRNKRQNVGWL